MDILNNAFYGINVPLTPFILAASIPAQLMGLNPTFYSGNLNYFLRDSILSPSENLSDVSTFRFFNGTLQILVNGTWTSSSLNLSPLLDAYFSVATEIAFPGSITLRGFSISDTPTLVGEGTNGYFGEPTTDISLLTVNGQPFFYAIPRYAYRYGYISKDLQGIDSLIYFTNWVLQPNQFISTEQWISDPSNVFNLFSNPEYAAEGYWFGNNEACGGCSTGLMCLRNDDVPFGGTPAYLCQNPSTYRQGPTGFPGFQGTFGKPGPAGPVGLRGEKGPDGNTLSPQQYWTGSTTLALLLVFFFFFFIVVLFSVFVIVKKIPVTENTALDVKKI